MNQHEDNDALFDDDSARVMRNHWFRYLDTLEPMRAELFGYCVKLTHNVWQAEDLVQDTLLTGFAMVARGDLHGRNSAVANARAYLFRTATNAWIDTVRHQGRLVQEMAETALPNTHDEVEVQDAMVRALNITSAQEFAAFVLKEGYGFTLEEIADFVGTTEGTIKSALSRARKKMQRPAIEVKADETLMSLAKAFANAINQHDLEGLLGLMSDTIQIKVCNVGGGRGRSGSWASSMQSLRAECAVVGGVPIVLVFKEGNDNLYEVLRVEGERECAVRLYDYCYCPDVLHYVAKALHLPCAAVHYHQPWSVIDSSMVPTTELPWLER